jgi:hypothetical protein
MKLTALGEFAVRQLLTLRCRFLRLPPCCCHSHPQSCLVLLSCDARPRGRRIVHAAVASALDSPSSLFCPTLLPPKPVLRLCFAPHLKSAAPPLIRWSPRCTILLKFGVELVFADTCTNGCVKKLTCSVWSRPLAVDAVAAPPTPLAVVADMRRVATVGGERGRQGQGVPSGMRPGAMRCFVLSPLVIGTCRGWFFQSYGGSLVCRIASATNAT